MRRLSSRLTFPSTARAILRGLARLSSLALVGLLVASCGSTEPATTVLLVNGHVVDGTGAPARDVAVRLDGDTIFEIGDLEPLRGEEVIDLGGLVLAPGFIDTHSHADGQVEDHPDALAAVSQGITTVVVGNDGGSPSPLADFFARLEARPPAINFAAYSGHGTHRADVMGEDFRRAATAEEIEHMAELLRADLDAGALGLSTGLEYDPGIYSDRSEVIELARVAAGYGGRYISHIRSEDRYFWDAIDELVEIGRQTGMPVQVGHMKLAMKASWGQAGRLLEVLDAARSEGIDVTADVYPWEYWQSTLTVLFPGRDFQDLDEARLVLEQIVPPEGVLVTQFVPRPEYAGKTLAEIATMRGEDPAVALLTLIAIAEEARKSGEEFEDGVESMIGTSMTEADIVTMMQWPHTNFCTDGELMGAHPRGFGSYPRILGHYVRELHALTLPDAIHKASALAAEHMGIEDRGIIATGLKADLVLLDPETVIDRATTEDPHAVSEGIARVWVNGELVWDGISTTGARPGRVLRRSGASD